MFVSVPDKRMADSNFHEVLKSPKNDFVKTLSGKFIHSNYILII